jgi:hypothetical protein
VYLLVRSGGLAASALVSDRRIEETPSIVLLTNTESALEVKTPQARSVEEQQDRRRRNSLTSVTSFVMTGETKHKMAPDASPSTERFIKTGRIFPTTT